MQTNNIFKNENDSTKNIYYIPICRYKELEGN